VRVRVPPSAPSFPDSHRAHLTLIVFAVKGEASLLFKILGELWLFLLTRIPMPLCGHWTKDSASNRSLPMVAALTEEFLRCGWTLSYFDSWSKSWLLKFFS